MIRRRFNGASIASLLGAALLAVAASGPAGAQNKPGTSPAERPPSDQLRASAQGMAPAGPAEETVQRTISTTSTQGPGPSAAKPPEGMKAMPGR